MALKRHFAMKPWMEWPEEVRLRSRSPERYRTVLSEDVALFTYIQYLFYRQWAALRAYARERGVGIIGDLPIYGLWTVPTCGASPESFQLDEKRAHCCGSACRRTTSAPTASCGESAVSLGRYEKDGFGWWIRRVEGAAELFDVLRIDHFRGLRVIGRFLTALLPPAADSGSKGRVWIW